MTDAPATLLLVDDNEAKRYVFATWLRRAGYTVIEAETGEEALAKAASAELILLDVNLPDINGVQVCQRVKADPHTAAIPVIQISATAVTVTDRAYGLSQGADAYLTDPSEPEELLATVVAALRYYRARQRAERTASRLAALTSATLNVNAAETFDGLAAAATTGAATIFNTPAAVTVVLPDGQLRRMTASPQRPVPVRAGGQPALLEAITKGLLSGREGSAAATIVQDEWLRLVPDTIIRGDACLAAARAKTGRPAVAMAVADSAVCGDEERQIFRQLAQSVALAVEALRSYAEEHLIALTLQRSFLPSELPKVPGVTMAARYLPASDQAEVGGDFYEAMTWHDQILLAIGDVQGHSVHAATVMGELRHALRAFASEGHPPLAITGLVNDVLQRYYPSILATLCIALVDPASGRLEVVTCGHLPPLVIDGTKTAYLEHGSLLLGIPVHKPRSEQVFLPPGGTLLLFTDGLVEDRGVFLDTNLERLRAFACRASTSDLEIFSDQVISLFGAREDDVALIALRRTESGEPGASVP
jgi:serine phosphatase RsbU (regulator of sigma subunit)/FixJ family two-component response regulator